MCSFRKSFIVAIFGNIDSYEDKGKHLHFYFSPLNYRENGLLIIFIFVQDLAYDDDDLAHNMQVQNQRLLPLKTLTQVHLMFPLYFVLVMCGILSAIPMFLSVTEMSLFVKIYGVFF